MPCVADLHNRRYRTASANTCVCSGIDHFLSLLPVCDSDRRCRYSLTSNTVSAVSSASAPASTPTLAAASAVSVGTSGYYFRAATATTSAVRHRSVRPSLSCCPCQQLRPLLYRLIPGTGSGHFRSATAITVAVLRRPTTPFLPSCQRQRPRLQRHRLLPVSTSGLRQTAVPPQRATAVLTYLP